MGKSETLGKRFIPAFKIFKEGMTANGPVTILKDKLKPFDMDAKKSFYRALGYEIIEL